MKDDLQEILDRLRGHRPSMSTARPPVGPCVQGGQPLGGGPRLDVGLSLDDQGQAADPPLPPALPHHAISQGVIDESLQLHQLAAEAPYLPQAPESTGSQTGRQMVAVDLWKSYYKGGLEVPVLRGLDLEIGEGEFVAVEGQSGSGKSTLLHLLGTLDAPDRGEIYFEGHRIDELPAAGRDILRNRHFGMIFQFYHLLPELTTLENVLAPLMIASSTLGYLAHRRRHRRAAKELLERVGLGHRLKHKPRELSGGEMQRAAIARALIAGPDLLLADEPTGNLDQDTGQEIMKILVDLNRQQNLTIVMVTHDRAIAQQADRIVQLADGRIDG